MQAFITKTEEDERKLNNKKDGTKIVLQIGAYRKMSRHT